MSGSEPARLGASRGVDQRGDCCDRGDAVGHGAGNLLREGGAVGDAGDEDAMRIDAEIAFELVEEIADEGDVVDAETGVGPVERRACAVGCTGAIWSTALTSRAS